MSNKKDDDKKDGLIRNLPSNNIRDINTEYETKMGRIFINCAIIIICFSVTCLIAGFLIGQENCKHNHYIEQRMYLPK